MVATINHKYDHRNNIIIMAQNLEKNKMEDFQFSSHFRGTKYQVEANNRKAEVVCARDTS